MRIGVLCIFQHSVFSGGAAQASLAVAEVLKQAGHTVELVNLGAPENEWWDDCRSIKAHWTSRHWKAVTEKYDLVVEIGKLVLSEFDRKEIAKATVWVARHPFLLDEMEACLFPIVNTAKREFGGLREVWIMDTAIMDAGDKHALELMTRVPVRVLPFVWTPAFAMTHLAETAAPTWMTSSISELKRVAESGQPPLPKWVCHVAETNTSNRSSVTLPTVILREIARRGVVKLDSFKIHNADIIKDNKFYRENVFRHCLAGLDLSGEFVGRQRAVEWVREPFSILVSHNRFQTIRPLLLDLAWAGVPVVHNSPILKEVGALGNWFYPDNHIGAAAAAVERVATDLQNLTGPFAPGALEEIRSKLLQLSPASGEIVEAWASAASAVEVAPAAASPSVAPRADAPQKEEMTPTPSRTLRVGFCDMWDKFQPEYNFFIQMLQVAAAALPNPVQVIGEPATAASSVVIFGPFGNDWQQLPPSIPKIHFTGENTVAVVEEGIKLNLGFQHVDMAGEEYLRFPLWLLYIDWFGADKTKFFGPHPIPLEEATKVSASALARKKKFCAFVVSNPSNPVRNAAFQWLNEYKPVDSAGRLFNNVGEGLFAGLGGGGGELAKFEFLKDYKFCLAYENSSSRGYTTEKFLHAKAAGCIPIYWGDPDVDRDFSIAGAIDARKFQTPEELIEAVRKVDEDDSEWLRRYSVPVLDSYKLAWARRTMAELSRRIFNLGGFVPESEALPKMLEGRLPESVGAPVHTPVAAPLPVPQAPVAVAPPPPAAAAAVTPPDNTPLELPLMVTCTTRRFLSSLQHWLMSVGTQLKGTPDLRALVFLGSDVPDSALPVLQQKFPFASFERLPDSSPPPGAFEDFWAPEHYGWKLWIYNELNQRQDLSGRMIFYTDAGSFLCRWPKDWLLRAQANDVCLLEDPRQENRRWCSPEFCAALSPTAAELSAQQRLGGLVSFRAGSSRAKAFFSEAYSLAHQRNILVGPKWAGTTPEGLPYGHRHDQSILSLLSLRHGIATHPLDDVYCDHSLRKTFTTGRSLYVHRGNFTVHKPFAEGIDEAYVINLDRRKDRMERLWSNHPELNGRVERWPAIEGKNLRLTPALEGLLRPNDFFWKKAVTGCALSHLGLWWKLGHEHPDIQNYLILEDDVKFRPGWEEAWRKAVAAGDIPQDYDIIYLGGVLPPNRAGFEQFAKERVNDSFSRVKPNTLFNQTEPNRYFHFCAYAYVLSRSGAEKIMSLLEGAGGYWTSADHILCNPVTVLRSYFLDPLVAGCYQDDDPKYANSEFNNFSRIDEFDSDLWNNDERFTPEEIAAVAAPEGTPINIPQALLDARQPPTTTVEVQQTIGRVAPAQATVELRKELSTPKVKGNPIKLVGRRIVALAEQGLHFKDLYESNWLLDLFGRPSMLEVTSIQPRDPPPTDEPIVIFQRPHVEKLTAMLEKWDSFGAKFRILHLSDEFGTDPISAYDLSGCTSVLRIYLRPDAVTHPKVTTIPLGYHWTLLEGSKDAVNLTPHLPFRQQDWTFFGTVWNDRQRLLQPLTEIPGIRYAAQFFHQWNDSNCLKQEEYIGALLNSIFVPCPDGMNPETFRFYEALDCGAVPLLVRTQKNAAWVDWVSEHLGLLPLSSWDEAAKLVEQLLQQKPLLEQYREKVLMAWEAWKKALRGSVGHWLQGEAQ